jgi:hypothetical protein
MDEKLKIEQKVKALRVLKYLSQGYHPMTGEDLSMDERCFSAVNCDRSNTGSI